MRPAALTPIVPAPVCVVSRTRACQANSGVGVSVGGITRTGGGVLLGEGVDVGVVVGETVAVGVGVLLERGGGGVLVAKDAGRLGDVGVGVLDSI